MIQKKNHDLVCIKISTSRAFPICDVDPIKFGKDRKFRLIKKKNHERD